ncbi:MAG: cyclase family protein [Thermoanaerobaculia bacterium]|nr:cyclase family protein [Thermoanaerobaculia bacterium]
MARIYDLSPVLSPRIAVWPGDVPFSREVTTPPDGTTFSSIRTTLHLGSHADAPLHMVAGAAAIDEVPLETWIGTCQVVEARVSPRGRVRLEDLAEPPSAPRVILKTGTFGNRERFDDAFAGLDPELAPALAARGVVLVGIDTPSVDPYDDHAYTAHRALVAAGVCWLEGLALADVPPGRYELSALPLRIEGGDGSPVRAVLVAP